VSTLAVALRQPASRTAATVLWAFASVAVALGAARAVTTTYVPVLLERIADRPGLIGAVMLVNAAAGFVVPLVTGLWSDRRGNRAPFILGGAVVAAGGLVAVALGTASSYLVLALSAATVYIGLNAASTAHRALVAERFAADGRAAATSAQEGAMLAGALAGTLVGGALIDSSAPALFALWALALPLLALPTLAWQRAAAPIDTAEPAEPDGPALRLLTEVLRRDGARHVLVAQILWVASYAALAPFMVLYAEEVLGLRAAAAGALLAGFGVITGAGMLVGARLSADRLRRTLMSGVALLGGGLLAATAASTAAQAAVPFGAAALGAGLVSATGFPYFTRFVPDGQAGRYAGAFFSARAIASTAALPGAGLLIAATGSYRALLGMGALGLAGLVPLARAERRRGGVVAAPLPPIRRLTAVIPVYRSDRVGAVTAETLRHVDEVVLVDDAAPAPIAAVVADAARDPRVRVLHMGRNRGKGTAVAAGIAAALEQDPDAVIVLDSDGQHPADLIPDFVAAAERAEVVIGDRPRAAAMPALRRLANATSSLALSLAVGQRLRDTQNGMRLFRAGALRAVPPPDGRYEAETRHLKGLVRSGRRVTWVPMAAIYDGEPSSFRAVADTLRVAGAVLAPARLGQRALPAPTAAPLRHAVRDWAPRIGLGMLLAWTVAAALPLLGGADERLFLAINGLGDGPEWLYQALDPHSRNYLLLAAAATLAVLARTRRLRYAGGALLAMAFAGVFADLVLEVVQLAVDRPRPEEALGTEALRSHGRHWSHIPSYPSGHLIVTTALVTAAAAIAPLLRIPAFTYLAAIAVTRITFGAHFPLDVVVGTIIGWQVGLFSIALMRAADLLPQTGRIAPDRRTATATSAPIAMPNAAPASTSSQK
jgi:membrane-associated phospholipid phosphatase/predicted MFS family arabinose efflux permease